MNTQRLAQLSQRMSLITLLLIVTMLLLNAAILNCFAEISSVCYIL
jgi:hypothetical protein